MRKVLLGLATGISLVLAAGGAAADGMYGGGIKDAGCSMPFQGLYAGLHGGFAELTSHQNDLDGFLTDNSGWTASDDQFSGGLQIGYNWQRSCNTLFGVEADWAWGDMDATTVDNPNGGGTPGSMTTSVESYGTLRTKAGLVLDNLLLYVTGGFAFATIDFDVTEGATFSFSDTRWGWTAGVGTEWAIWKNVSLKSEVLYMGFSDEDYSFTTTGTTFAFSTEDSLWVSRVGLNFRY